MAKRGVLEHPKTLALADALGIMEPFALGLLEAFWHWTAKYHPNGDVTGTNPSMFARSIRYTGDADGLWGMMVDCKFVDMLDDGRSLVHDWSEHADDCIRKALHRRGETFADGSSPFRRKSANNCEPLSDNGGNWQPTSEIGETNPDNGGQRPTMAEIGSLPDTRYQIPDTSKEPCADKPAPAEKKQALLELLPPKAAKQVKVPDYRFMAFKDEIGRYWEENNPNVEMPWDGSEAKRLNELLKACPKLDIFGLAQMLNNRAKSDVVHSVRPRAWLANVVDYANGPINQYGKPKQAQKHLEAAVGSRPLTETDDPVVKLIWETDTHPHCNPGMTAEECADLALEINAAKKRPLRISQADLVPEFVNLLKLRSRVNAITAPIPKEMRPC